MDQPILQVNDLKKYFPVRRGILGRDTAELRAVDGVTFALRPGTTMGIVGESGCGKSTLARTLMLLETPTSGDILFNGSRVTESEATQLRKRMQIVFQDPYTSLPPRMKIGDIIAEPLRIHGRGSASEHHDTVRHLLREVGINPARIDQYPFQFSGGQRQRVGIARALAVDPEVLLLDEAVSALDVSVQAQILNLLQDLQERHALTYLFISHDLSVVRYLSDTISVMYLGKIVEQGPAEDVYNHSIHPYTRALLSAVPSLKHQRHGRIHLKGEPPKPTAPPPGCPFHPRCPLAQPICSVEVPLLQEWLPGRWSACHFAGELASGIIPERV